MPNNQESWGRKFDDVVVSRFIAIEAFEYLFHLDL